MAQVDSLIVYLETLINYFPNITPELESFLSALLRWVRSSKNFNYNFQPITSSSYRTKITALDEQFSPFADTRSEWSEGGCAGSSPEKRGYPCSLWSLFHALMASAVDKVSHFSFLDMYPVNIGVVVY